jgi:hypothetical protein
MKANSRRKPSDNWMDFQRKCKEHMRELFGDCILFFYLNQKSMRVIVTEDCPIPDIKLKREMVWLSGNWPRSSFIVQRGV